MVDLLITLHEVLRVAFSQQSVMDPKVEDQPWPAGIEQGVLTRLRHTVVQVDKV